MLYVLHRVWTQPQRYHRSTANREQPMLTSTHKRQAYQLSVSAAVFVPLFAATYYAAFLLRFAGEPNSRANVVYFNSLVWLVSVKWSAFTWFRLHQGWARFVGIDDLWVLAKAVTCSALGLTLVDAFCLTAVTIPRSVILIDWGTTLLAVAAVCALPRLVRNDSWHLLAPNSGTRCLIVGANDAGETLLQAIRSNSSLVYRVVGFIDNCHALQGCRVGGVPVIGSCDELPQLVEQHGVEEVLIMSGGLPGTAVRRLVESSQLHGFRVKVLPSYEQLLAERVATRPRAVAIGDLLSRDSVELDLDAIRDWIDGRVIMVTGSAGSIGSEICRQLLRLQPARLVLVDRSETGQFHLERELLAQRPQSMQPSLDVRLADLTDRDRLDALFAETRPEIIFHAAAYKHVPLMESHCGEAVKNIVLATRNLVDLAHDFGSHALVMISTDKAVNPTSVMGSCKRLAEQYVQARSMRSNCRFVTVRFGNVLDSSGSVVPIFRQQIAQGGPVTVTHPEITRYFMLIPEAAQLVLQAGAMGKGGEIFVLDMGEPVRILDLAQDMIRLSGLRVDEDIEVEFVGLRPGEKLYEELYDADERRQRTAHPKILVATSTRRNLPEVIRDIARVDAVKNEPNDLLKATLREMIDVQCAEDFVRVRAAA
jgi:FlaA1/EpsC-like NDP-sugar epimerase